MVEPRHTIARANSAILEKLVGVPLNPTSSNASAGNPNLSPSCDSGYSSAGSNTGSDRVLRRSAPHLRLVCAPSRG